MTPRRPAYLPPTNAVVKTLSRLGVRTGAIKVLTVVGRTSGRPRSTPVSPVHLEERRFLLAPMPDADWVRNARAAGTGQLTDGPSTEQVLLRELTDPDLRRAVMTAFPAAVPDGVRLFKALGLVTSADPAQFTAAADQVTAFEVLPAPAIGGLHPVPTHPLTATTGAAMSTGHETHDTHPAPVRATEIVLPGIVEPAGLQIRTRELPAPGRGQALVAVQASGVSFAEQSMRRGRYPGQPKFPFVPGYDLVGTVRAVGPGADSALIGQQVATMTKTGGWASHVLLPAADMVPVPAGLDPAEAETLIVNGVTAWQMLHRKARVRAGQTILVHGANGGVGTTLVQLARHAGVRVIGTSAPRHHDALRALGAEPIDYDGAGLAARVRALAPGGVDAAFNHIGGDSLVRSWRLLAPGGTLVSYAIASKVSGTGSIYPAFFATLARLIWWNTLPNGKRAVFYDLWAGHRRTPAAFRTRTRTDMGAVLDLLADGVLTAQVAARFPLTQASEAMELAESHTVTGKVVLTP